MMTHRKGVTLSGFGERDKVVHAMARSRGLSTIKKDLATQTSW